MNNTTRLRGFIRSFTDLIEQAGDNEQHIFTEGKGLLLALVSYDDWLPDDFAQPSSEQYQQYLLYCDPMERFSVVSFVWGPGQTTPVHDHTVWGMIGVMRGAEACEEFALDTTGRLLSKEAHQLTPGNIDLVSPHAGDIHKVSNALTDRVSISIHVYGANIGAVKRHIYEPDTGRKKTFVSGYSSKVIPNIWDRSAELTTGN